VEDQVDRECRLALPAFGDQQAEPELRQDAIVLGTEERIGCIALIRDELVEGLSKGALVLFSFRPRRVPLSSPSSPLVG
jgi:hypothetical protein